MPYRPEFMGIEGFWKLVKKDYRARVNTLLSSGGKIDMQKLVADAVASVAPALVKRKAKKGNDCLLRGNIIDPLAE